MKNTIENRIDIINENTLDELSNRIAIAVLKTIYNQSASPIIKDLYNGLIDDILHGTDFDHTLSDGFDIKQEVTLCLCCYMGKSINDNGTTTDKNGNPLPILREAFRVARNYIYNQKQKHYSHLYVEDPETLENIAVPFEWDMPTFEDLTIVNELIDKMNLTDIQMTILRKRLQGKSLREVARELQRDIKTIRESVSYIQIKAKKIGLTV